MNKFVKVSFIAVLLVVAGCQGLNNNKNQPSLADAKNAIDSDSEKSIVFATLDANELGDVSGGNILHGLLLGSSRTEKTAVPALSFSVNVYDIKSPSLKRMFEKNPNKNPNALGGFDINENRPWSVVFPGQYAVDKFLSRDMKLTSLGGWARQDKKAYMVFNVNPGEIIYLGHVKAALNNEGIVEFIVEDRFDSFAKTLPADMRSKIQKRIVKAPSSLRAEKVERAEVLGNHLINKYPASIKNNLLNN